MKRIISLFLACAALFSLTGCKKYKPVKSTDRESAPVITMTYGGKKYEANYELFRMLLLSAKETVSGNDPNKFEGSEGAALLEEAKAIAIDKIYDIYSVFALCDALDIDLHSRKVNKEIEESITVSIEGGYGADGQPVTGLGSYEAYLENLSLFYMNYAVQDLMLRYSYGVSAISAYYRGTSDEYGNVKQDGKLSYTKEDVTAYYNSEDTRRILFVFTTLGETEAAALRDAIAALPSESAVSDYMLGHSTASEADAKDGMVIGKYSLDNALYSKITDAAFSLAVGETSGPIECIHMDTKGHFILYRAEKSPKNLEEAFESVETFYVENEIGKRYAEAKQALQSSAAFTAFFDSLVLKDIHMEEEKK